MNIGEKIVVLRKKYNFTQEKLAQKIGISRQTLANWESNLTSPDLKQAGLLSQILKVSLDELVNQDFEIVCKHHLEDEVFKHLIGKTCYLNMYDDLDYDMPVKVLDATADFIKIEYLKGQKNCIQLIDLDLVMSIKVEG